MTANLVTLFGGSGFLGRRIAVRLVQGGYDVRIAVRDPERAAGLLERGGAMQVTCVRADLRDEATVAAALAGSASAVNAVGHYVKKGSATFEAIHGHGAAGVARQAQQAGVRRLVHVSGIGADPESASSYVRARAMGERLVAEAFPGATVLRPSVLFGPEDNFINMLARLARYAPALPLFGRGETRLQPVFVGDVAEACVRALTDAAAAGRIYELGGPDIYSYYALLRLILERTGRRRLLVPVPFALWEVLAALAAVLPNPPVTRDQIVLMRRDNVVGQGPGSQGSGGQQTLTLQDLGITPAPLADVLPQYENLK